jgi:hypothetical protein
MDRAVSHGFATPRYRYGAIEEALANIFGLDDGVQRGPLRGRLKRLGQLGLPGVGQGKGQRVLYSYEQTTQLAVALLIAELGVDPTVIARLVKGHWKTIAPWVRRATDDDAKAGDSVFLTLRPRLMSGPWSELRHALETVPWMGGFRRFDRRLKDKEGRPIQRENVSMFLDRCAEKGWLCCRNLTEDLTRLKASLDRLGDEARRDHERRAS